jgi:hypothetical protein
MIDQSMPCSHAERIAHGVHDLQELHESHESQGSPRYAMLRSLKTLALLGAVGAAAGLAGCEYSTWDSMSEQSVKMGGVVDRVSDLESRTFSFTLAPNDDGTVYVRNIAGSITIRQDDDVDEVIVEAVVRGEANPGGGASLLDGMQWAHKSDTMNNKFWALNYPVDKHRTYHYQWDDAGFEAKSDGFDGHAVRVITRTADERPTLFADLTIVCPAGTNLNVLNLAGVVSAGPYTGDLTLRVLVGRMAVESCTGDLVLDGTALPITVGEVEGSAVIDTGSGEVNVTYLNGNGVVDTGSGKVHIGEAVGDSLIVDTGSGNVNVNTLGMSTVDIDTGSGDVRLGDGFAREIITDTGSGRIAIEGATFIKLLADTGSGGISIRSSLIDAESLALHTGSGSVKIETSPDAAFTLTADQGSGRLRVGFDDAETTGDGRRLTGASRGADGPTITVDTGSGDCEIAPWVEP